MVAWVSLFGVLLQELIGDKISPVPTGVLVTIVAHFFYGLSLAIFTKLLAGNMTFFTQDLRELTQAKGFRLYSSTPIKRLLVKKNSGFKKPKKI